jgi:hypothetical protein
MKGKKVGLTSQGMKRLKTLKKLSFNANKTCKMKFSRGQKIHNLLFPTSFLYKD